MQKLPNMQSVKGIYLSKALTCMYKFLVEKYIFTIFACELFNVKQKIVNNTRNTLYLGQNTSKYRSQIIVVYVHANGFL